MAMPRLNAPAIAGADALKRLLAGDLDGGLELYRTTLDGEGARKVPVGLHLVFLRRAGQSDAAEALLQLAVESGANVAPKAGGFGAQPAEAAQEYEELFAQGIVNAFMVSEYLFALARVGRFADLARWLDTPRRLRKVCLELAAPGGDRSLAEAVQELILEAEEKAVYQEAVQSVRQMHMIGEFTRSKNPVVGALLTALMAAARSYLEDWASSDHPLASFVPSKFRLDGWALISRGRGYNVRHVHHRGWATGVYYPAPVHGGGELHVGRPETAPGTDEQWGAACFRPEPGLLVLMPSFYTHWTVPLKNRGLRTAVAFDLSAEGP